jgi:hypothetical protein
MSIGYEIWEVTDLGICIIKIRLINEMPSRLIGSTSIFDLISEGSALNHWVFTFILSVRWVGLLKNSEDILNLSKNIWVLGSKDILGNSTDEKVTIIPPGGSSTDLSGADNQETVSKFHI